jgi:hypothetical protein
MLQNINLHDGKIIFENISTYQKSPFEENLLYIEYGTRYAVDVAWYPSMPPQGCFVIIAIQDSDWDNPLLCIKTEHFEDLGDAIQKAIDYLNHFIRENPDRPLRENI